MNPNDYTAIKVERLEYGVVRATLNDPDMKNAIVGRMHAELSRLAADFDHDVEARVLLLAGAGDCFASGAKEAVTKWHEAVTAVAAAHDGAGDVTSVVSEGGDVWFEARRIVDGMLECRKPIISAVHGEALGLGATVALLADVVIAGHSTVFGDPHVKMGIGAGDGGQVIWPLLVGPNKAKYYLMTGDSISAAEAERLGLVNFVVEDDQVAARALEIATRLARGPLQAIIASKAAISQWMRAQSNQILPLSLNMERLSQNSTDAQEGMKAMIEGREPNFTGQ